MWISFVKLDVLKNLLWSVAFSMTTFHLGEQISCTFADDERVSAPSLLAEHLFLPPLPFTCTVLEEGMFVSHSLVDEWPLRQHHFPVNICDSSACLCLLPSVWNGFPSRDELFIHGTSRTRWWCSAESQWRCCMAVVCSDCRESRWTGCPPSPQSAHTARLGRPWASAATTSSTQTTCVLCVAKGEERDAVWRCSEKNDSFLEIHLQTDFVTAEHKGHTLDSLGGGILQSRCRKVQRKGSFLRTLASGRRTVNSLWGRFTRKDDCQSGTAPFAIRWRRCWRVLADDWQA